MKPATTRRERRREELKARILEAAREIVARQGYESFSMRNLASKIDYSPGVIYLHFKGKEALFRCLVEQSFERLHSALQVLRDEPNEDPVKVLKAGLKIYVEFGLRHPDDYRLAFLLQPPKQPRPYTTHPAFDVLRRMVGRCVAQGRFGSVDRETASQALWAAVHGVTALLIQRPTFPWVPKKRLVQRVIDSAVDALGTTRTRRKPRR
jgi:AcrR family transcriptional regulator